MKRDMVENLFAHLFSENAEQTLYVYRVGPDGRLIKPYLLQTCPWRIVISGCYWQLK